MSRLSLLSHNVIRVLKNVKKEETDLTFDPFLLRQGEPGTSQYYWEIYFSRRHFSTTILLYVLNLFNFFAYFNRRFTKYQFTTTIEYILSIFGGLTNCLFMYLDFQRLSFQTSFVYKLPLRSSCSF